MDRTNKNNLSFITWTLVRTKNSTDHQRWDMKWSKLWIRHSSTGAGRPVHIVMSMDTTHRLQLLAQNRQISVAGFPPRKCWFFPLSITGWSCFMRYCKKHKAKIWLMPTYYSTYRLGKPIDQHKLIIFRVSWIKHCAMLMLGRSQIWKRWL